MEGLECALEMFPLNHIPAQGAPDPWAVLECLAGAREKQD